MRFGYHDAIFRLEFGYGRLPAPEGQIGHIGGVSAYLWQVASDGRPVLRRHAFVDLTNFKGHISKEQARIIVMKSLTHLMNDGLKRAVWAAYITRRAGSTKDICPHCQKDRREPPLARTGT